MRILAVLGVLLLWAFPGLAAKNKSRHNAPRKHPIAAARSKVKPVVHGKSAHGKSAVRSRTKSRSKRFIKQRQTWRTGQMAPTPERYKEIQQALLDKGYASQAPDGVWGARWVESLQRFQQDQKLEPNGKLTALSLITLGLGPHRENGLPAAPASAGAVSTDSISREQQ
ncbi:MAG TPA: peptidoglycan-binding domain-containing protein [Bryobacteraceae bacterium]